MSILTLRPEIPRVYVPLLGQARYKAAYGGRGSGKSHHFGEQLILRAYSRPTRWACIRQVQNTIKESVRQLLVDKIAKFGLEAHFEVKEGEIVCPHDGLIIFRGMQSYNAESIKSLENYDGAWVEEAQTLSAQSLRMLRPTIRKEDSEIWASWNPRFETDPVDAFFRGAKPPDNALIVQANWNDNPWFPDVLREEKEHDEAVDPEMAEHVWGGGYQIITEGSYYARLIMAAENEGRVGDFPYDPSKPVQTAWDIGIDDHTAVWFIQEDGTHATVIDYYEASGLGAQDIVKEALPELNPEQAEKTLALAELERAEPFKYGQHFLPHDVMVREWGGGGKERIVTLNELGVKPIHAGAQQGPAERINASRALLPKTRFNRTPRVVQGLKRLRNYSRRWNQTLETYGNPLHDENSHGADAFGEFAVNCRIVKAQATETKRKRDRWDRAFDDDDDEVTSWKVV